MNTEITFLDVIIIMGSVIIAIYGLSLFFTSNSEDTMSNDKSKSSNLSKVEQLSEKEFIDFVRDNYGYFDEHFKNEGVGGNRLISKWCSTSRYTIKSDYDDDNLNDFITIVRKSDNKKIFSGCWGLSEDEY